MTRLATVGPVLVVLVGSLLVGSGEARAARPAAVERLYLEGLRRFAAGDFEEATKPLAKALDRGRWTDVRLLLARAYVRLRRCSELEALLDGLDLSELPLEQRRYALDFLSTARERCATPPPAPGGEGSGSPKPKLPMGPPGEDGPDAERSAAGTPEGMVRIAGGRFRLGDRGGARDERPRRVAVSTFFLDRTEVTSAAYRACVVAGGCPAEHVLTARERPACTLDQPGRESFPVNCVAWEGAEAFCRWRGRRLPTEAEWELAARGREGRPYPWGREAPTCARCGIGGHTCGSGAVVVGSRPEGASPEGVLDLCGNVMEWVADWYAADAYRKAAAHDPSGPESGEERVVRGGVRGRRGWVDTAAPADLESTVRASRRPATKAAGLGFRCASGASE